MNNLLFDFSSGVQGRSPGRGSGGRSPSFKSSYKQIVRIFGSNSHTIYEVETLIIENENYEAQPNPQIVRKYELLSSSVWKKWVKQLGTPNVHVSPI